MLRQGHLMADAWLGAVWPEGVVRTQRIGADVTGGVGVSVGVADPEWPILPAAMAMARVRSVMPTIRAREPELQLRQSMRVASD